MVSYYLHIGDINYGELPLETPVGGMTADPIFFLNE
jgi:hypothetical protein